MENWHTRDVSYCMMCNKKVLVSQVVAMGIYVPDIHIFCSPQCTMKWAHEIIDEADAEMVEIEAECRAMEKELEEELDNGNRAEDKA